ncbi:MAG: RNA methyltransferase [Oscillospiraceae bacterium]|nr:RNA methyltransferase [Oscillospiraceae bacterium]
MNVTEVTDLSSEGVRVYSHLTEAQLRNRLEPSKGIFIAESPKVINVALNEGLEPVSMLMDRRHIDGSAREVIDRCDKYDIPLYTAESDILEQLAGFRLTRGVLCAMRRPAPKSISDTVTGAHRIAVLENIADSTNIGAIFRSAAALGTDAVLLTPDCCDPLNRRAVRVSMGTVFQIPWAYFEKDEEWTKTLSGLGFATAAMALSDDSVSIDDPRLKGEDRLAIVLGTEGDGLCKETIARCDYTVKIPMLHGVDSLNVAAAGALAFWELRMRR